MSGGWELGLLVVTGYLLMGIGCVYLGVQIGKWMRGDP